MLSRLFARREPQARPLFALGSLRLSEKVHWLASKGLIDPLPYVQRHVRGDWGAWLRPIPDAGGAATQCTAKRPLSGAHPLQCGLVGDR